MKRNRFGINLDEGIPLNTQLDFDLLHVDCFPQATEKLMVWIEDSDGTLAIGGQIGSGKTTLIRNVLKQTTIKPDFLINYDQESLNLDAGDFWAATLVQFIKVALKHHIDLSFSKLPKELGSFQPNDWNSLLNNLEPRELSMEAFYKKIELRRKIAENEVYIREVIRKTGEEIENALNRHLFIFALGLDKFDTKSAAFLSARDIISALSAYKTLYEVNALQLFPVKNYMITSDAKLFLPAIGYDDLINIYHKRMGVYGEPIAHEMDMLAQWSGGNPRQALRLLNHFYVSKKRKTPIDSISYALSGTANDFFSYLPKPSTELIKTVHADGYIETSLIVLPGDKETAQRALYGNWILFKENGTTAGLSSWPAIVNPLIKKAFIGDLTIEEPEVALLKDYANTVGISTAGLSPKLMNEILREDESDDRTDEIYRKEKSGDQIIMELISVLEHPFHANLIEIFEALKAALLSKDRADRVIIAYRDTEVVNATRAYLFAKANMYEYQICKHFVLEGGEGKQPIISLREYFLQQDTDIYSIEFQGEWEKTQLEALDRQRDRFIDYQMIWWIPLDRLKQYLPYWVQLRQLFEIFVLEDELLGSISIDEIESDIAFFQDMDEDITNESVSASVISNLKIFLEYLSRLRC